MERIFENKFMFLDFDTQKSFLHMVWHNTTDRMQDEEYKDTLIAFAKAALDSKAYLLLADTRSFRYVIHPDIQEWSAKEQIVVTINRQLKKVAIIIAKDLFVEVSIQQALEETHNEYTQTAYFKDEESAKKFLGV